VAEVAKLNERVTITDRRAAARGPLQASPTPNATTHAGGTGYERTDLTQLFLLTTTSFFGEDTFYEKADDQADRLRALVRHVALTENGWPWLKGFLPWLRGEANIRTASIVLALEAVKARLDDRKGAWVTRYHNGDQDGARQLVAAVLQRGDEPGEALAYWLTRFGRPIPKPVKRGVADAANRLYTERAYLRYDSEARGVRFADVLELTRPPGKPPADFLDKATAEDVTEAEVAERVRRFREERGRLYRWAITERQGRDVAPPLELAVVRDRWELNRLPAAQRHVLTRVALERRDVTAEVVAKRLERATAGQWEWLLSWLGERPTGDYAAVELPKLDQWRLVLPKLGYMALLRNLRNLDQAGLPDAEARVLADRLANPDEVARSRQLPFRFYSAYLNTGSTRWAHALDQALGHSLGNVPTLPGRTLILIDTSGSMQAVLSPRPPRPGRKPSTEMRPTRVRAAALFAFALALKQDGGTSGADVFGFADGQFKVEGIRRGDSVLRQLDTFNGAVGRVGHGTQIEFAVTQTFQRGVHDRVVIFTDMQTFPVGGVNRRYSMVTGYGVGDVARAVPPEVPVYGFNLAGYESSGMPAGTANRHELGGLTDHTFGLIRQLETARHGSWPWETLVG
jgi:hypothetical protein